MRAANQPMADPPGMPEERGLGDFFRLPLRSHWAVVVETLQIYKLSLFDRDEAIRQFKIDAEIQRQMDELRRKREAAGESQEAWQANAATDMADVAQRVRLMFPKELATVKSVDDAVRLAASKREDIHSLAADRLELIGTAIRSFMDGYRSGKDAARAEVESANDQTIDRLMAPLMAINPPSKESPPPPPPVTAELLPPEPKETKTTQ